MQIYEQLSQSAKFLALQWVRFYRKKYPVKSEKSETWRCPGFSVKPVLKDGKYDTKLKSSIRLEANSF